MNNTAPLPEDFEDEIDNLILDYRKKGSSDDEIISILELKIMAIKEGN